MAHIHQRTPNNPPRDGGSPVRGSGKKRDCKSSLVVVPYICNSASCQGERARAEQAAEKARHEERADVLRKCAGDVED